MKLKLIDQTRSLPAFQTPFRIEGSAKDLLKLAQALAEEMEDRADSLTSLDQEISVEL